MLLRNTTLARLGGVVAALGIVLVVNVWFWSSYTATARAQIKKFGDDLVRLKAEAESLKAKKEDSDRRANEYNQQILAREKELEQYGDFLPSIRTKPLVIKEILSLVEELGIKIWKIEYSPLVSEEGCYTFNFALKLAGPYKSFKLFLSKIYKSERIFRLKKFDIQSFHNEKHNMDVFVEFQTYFGES